MPAVLEAPTTPSESEESCLMCGLKGDIFTCSGGCGLHVHPTCIGEEAIFPFVGTNYASMYRCLETRIFGGISNNIGMFVID